jgi:hypothetical protein
MSTALHGRCLVVVMLVWLMPGHIPEANAKTLRVAIVVGNNEGDVSRAPLRYALSDARRVAVALASVGGFQKENLHLLLDGTDADLERAFADAERALLAAAPDQRVLLFYFSGHSDGTHLEMGSTRFPYVRLKELLASSTADVRLAFVDACMSGALVGAKGVTQGPSFDIDVYGDLGTQGTAILTSAGSGELALESARLGGSFFTHHLVSALYGAADADRDLRITLQETYRYVYRRTLGDTAANVTGPQHPSYSFELEGKGEFVVSSVPDGAAEVVFPVGPGASFFLVSLPDREVVAEVVTESGREQRLFVPSGDYLLLCRSGGGLRELRFRLESGERHTARPAKMEKAVGEVSFVRGGETARRNLLGAGYAMSGFFLPEMGAMHGFELSYGRLFDLSALRLRLAWGQASVNENGFVYDIDNWEGLVAALYRLAFYRVDLFAGLAVGLSYMRQETRVLDELQAWAAVTGAHLGSAVRVTERLVVMLAFELDVYLVYVDDRVAVRPAPRAFVGAGLSF